jgi:transcriptional regulator with XRE-family HTH domain
MTQLELALETGISARHLSFVETGRSHPGRATLLRILERLDVPFRERNRLLLAAGHAPAYPERSLDDADLGPVREAIDAILAGHEPYPAVAVDRVWNVVATNSAMLGLAGAVEIAPELLEPPVNVMRVGLHPHGLGPLFVNLGDWHAHWLKRLERQSGDNGRRAARLPDRRGRRLPRTGAHPRCRSGGRLRRHARSGQGAHRRRW